MTDKEKVINNEFETMGESSKQAENNALIKKNLQTVISENNKQDLTIFNQESKTNWTQIFGEGKGNELYGLSQHNKEFVGRDLTGLDKIMFERIIEKVGKTQKSTSQLVVGQTVFSLSNVIPFAGIPMTNGLIVDLDNALIKLEKSFTIEEVTEIVKEVGKLAGVDNSQLIKKIMEVGEKGQSHYEKILWEKDEEIKRLKAELTEASEEVEKLNQEKAERKETEKKLLETQNQLHSPDKVNLEELKEKHRRLELNAKTNEEILNTWKIKLDDYKIAVEQLKGEREREEQEKNRFLALYLNQKDIEIADHAEISRLKRKWNSTKQELETEQIKYSTAKYEKEQEEKKRQQEWNQYRHWEGEVARKNLQLETLGKKNEKLSQELATAQENAKPGLTGWLAEKTGFHYVKDVFYGAIIFFLVVLMLWLISFLWKWVIKPTIKNFTPVKKAQPIREQSSEIKKETTEPE